ncbi:MAG TPA: DUF362 domain-containing protein [Thermodesulfobacteriota bacterium]|nr:DUF362 domain-containing protein [Thermodesulfobacteriota bacterium]
MKDVPKVYFTNLRTNPNRSLIDKAGELLNRTGVCDKYGKGDIIAIKLHFGEAGNTSFIRPVFVRRIAERIKESVRGVFLTDTNTLYLGSRTNSVDHIDTAIANGFAYAVTGTPIIIADGLRGENSARVEVNGKHLKEAIIAKEIISSDGIVCLTHFKCHELTGFGGALKNMGMGCASREGKLLQHSKCAPKVNPDDCTACGDCAMSCPSGAIEVGKKAVIKDVDCVGCGYCIAICPEGAIEVQWNELASNIQEKMVEHVKGALLGKEGKCAFMNFLTQISPACDCYGHNDAPIVGDIGILASIDPVAIDQASVDLVNAKEGIKDTALASGFNQGEDKFRGVHPNIDWTVQLEHAERLGIGKRKYELIEI